MASIYDTFPRLAPISKMSAAWTEERMSCLVGHIQGLRDDGKLPEEIAFGHIARALTWLAETRVQAADRDGDLARISKRLWAIEKAAGLGDKEFWSNGDGPPDWQALNDQYNQRASEIVAELMCEHGEDGMAQIMLVDPERFDRLCEPGRRQKYDA